MSELKKLFRVQRILAMVLAVTLAMTSVPVTALAAEPDDIDIQQTAQDTDTEDASVKDDAQDADTEDGSVQDDAQAAGGSSAENDVQNAEDDSDQDDVSGRTGDSLDPDVSTEGDGTQVTDPASDANPEEKADVELGEPEFKGIKAQTSKYTADGVSPVADETGKKLSMDFLSNYVVIVNGESKSLVSVLDPVISTITYQWFAGESALGEPKKLSEEGSLPVDAGSYTVKLVLPAKENEYKSAEFVSGYEIAKSDVTVSIGTPDIVPVGTKCSEVPMPSVVSVIADNGKSFTYVVDDKSTEANEAENNEVEFAMVIKDATTGTVLPGEQTLMKNSEYVVSMVPAFVGSNKDKYEKNYTWKRCDEQKLPMGNLKATRLVLTPDASYGAKPATVANDDDERTVHIIEAASFTKEMQELKYTAALEAEDGKDEQNKPKWKTIEGQTIGEWYTAASYSEPWTEKDTTYCSLTLGSKLDTVPVVPGTYVYRISYEGDKKEYDASYADIVVVVAVTEIIVRPAVPANVVFYDGQEVKDVLSQITYELPYADGRTENGKELLYPQKSNMWGTSYDDKNKTQPYKPDFKLIEIIKDKDGKETNRTVYSSDSSNTLKLGNDYIVQFTGQKNVYYASGNPAPSVDINAGVDSMDPATCGFRVRTDQSTLEAETNTCKLEVVAKDKAIDVTEIEKAAADKAKMSLENVGALEGAYTKIYDGTDLFEFYADYRKAKLVSGTSNSYSDFTYTWQRSMEFDYEDLLGTHPEEGENVADVSKEDLENGIWGTVSVVSPHNTGIYRLHITYHNSRSKGFADPVDMYFVIKPQEITLTFNKTELVGNIGNDINDFITNHAQELNEGTIVTPYKDQPAKAEDWKNKNLLSAAADYTYQVSWDFYQKVKETNADGQEIDKYTQYFGSLQSGAEYFLGVSDFEMGRYNPENKWLMDSDTFSHNYSAKTDIYIPITVKDMGTDAIVFDGITTTGGKVVERTKTYDAETIFALIKDDLGRLNGPVAIKTDAAGAETKTSVTFAEGEYGLIYTVQYSGSNEIKTYKTLPTEETEWEWAKNAGTYIISVSFGGNEKYSPLAPVRLASITVNQKELIFMVPELTEEFTAGQEITDVMGAVHRAFKQQVVAGVKAVEGDIPEADKKYFTRTEINGATGFLAWYDEEEKSFDMPEVKVRDNVDNAEYDYGDYGVLLRGTGNERYSLIGDYAAEGYDYLTGICGINYAITAIEPAKGTPVKVVRGASAVAMEEYSGKKIDITDNIETPEDAAGSITKEHIVTIQDGIAYYNDINDELEEEGNIVKIQITAPAEYGSNSSFSWNKVIYEQAIKNAAGDRLIGSIDCSGKTLEFTYDVTVRDKEEIEDLVFCIRWEEDYNERFVLKFSESELLGNLMDAVAPKSLAFNAPLTTMVVGQEQELDVKIQKVQNADIICLGYAVTAGKEYVHVDEFGKVTALKDGGKATVEVFPMHLADGKKVRIEGAKSAKTNITVKKVSAPKVTKVTPKDTSVTIEYTLPAEQDGFRREIYVVEGKNVKADIIEKKVTDEMKNEQWQGIFAVYPKFVSYDQELSNRIYDNKKETHTNTVRLSIPGLELQKDYTVYVRNVSAVRSFADGCQVSLSAAGTAKSFKTTLKHVSDITALLDAEQIVSIDDEKVEETPAEDEIRDAYTIGYEVPLAKRNVQISLEGLFEDVAGDQIYVPIPFAGSEAAALRQSYAEPKIAYYFKEYIYDGYDAYSGDKIIEEWGCTTTSSIAVIDKKGKITLKQPGWVTVCAVDTVSGRLANDVEIHITAEADSMKAKNTVMQVGQSIRLENLIEYKQGKTVLNQLNYDTYGRIDVKAAQDSLKNAGKESSFSISDSGYLTAYAKDSMKLTLKDTVLNTSVIVNITAKELAAVKNLKAVNIIDNRFDVQFEMNPYAEAYRIEILDAKKIIRSIYAENIPFRSGSGIYYGWTDDDWGNDDEWDYDDNWTHNSEHFVKKDGLCRADKINGKWIFSYRIDRLTQTSKYNIRVTALFGEATSKTVKKAAATTKLPACDTAVSGKLETGKTYNEGLNVSRISFVSGNTYSIELRNRGDIKLNSKARIAGTDTLTWSSSDKKTATVTATSGGYSATLKALKAGKTVIEVRSKVLKGVIARVTVTVSAVGDAYKGRDYYGDNEDLRDDQNDEKKDAITELAIGVAEPVELSAGQSKSFKVTLTEEGSYAAYIIENGKKEEWDTCINRSKQPYEWFFDISGEFTGSVIVEKTGNAAPEDIKNRTVLKLNETLPQTRNRQWYVFTAPNDGLYGFKQEGKSVQGVFSVYKQSTDKESGSNTTDAELQKYFYELKKGDVVYLQANGNYPSIQIVEAKFEVLTAGVSATVSAGNEKWFEFTPAEMDQYEFRLSDLVDQTFCNEVFTGKNLIYYLDSQTSEHVFAGILNSKVYVRINNWQNRALTLQVNKKEAFRKFGEDGSCMVSEYAFSRNDDYLYLNYKVQADGFYTFSYEAAESGIDGYAVLYPAGNMDSSIGSMSVVSNGTDKIERKYLSKDEEVCLKIRPNGIPATWTNIKFTAAKTEEAPAELQAGGEAVPGTVSSDTMVWYSFTALEEGRYTVVFPKMENSTGSIRSTLYEDINSSAGTPKDIDLANGGYMSTISLNAGAKRFIKVESDSEQAFKIRVEKASSDKAVTTTTPVDLTEVENWVSFTADADGYYEFTVTAKAGNIRTYIYAYENAYDAADIASGSPLKAALAQGETIWLKIVANALLADTSNADQLMVQKLREVRVFHITEDSSGTLGEVATVEDSGNHYALVKIIADTEGRYTISCSNSNISSIALYTNPALSGYGSIIDSNSEGVYSVQRNMKAGEAIYLKLTASQEVTGIGLNVKSAFTRLLGQVDVQSGMYQWLEFTAPSAGNYLFYSTNNSGDPKAWFFTSKDIGDNAGSSDLNQSADLGYDDDGNEVDMSGIEVNGSNNFAKVLSLSAGDTIYLAVGYYNLSSPMSCDVYVMAQ